MAKEIERKFFLQDKSVITSAIAVHHIEQAYLSREPLVRLRIKDKRAFITIKSKSSDGGLSRNEWEYEIPYSDAQEMLSLRQGIILKKKRYLIPYAEHLWEIDIFEGEYEGLQLAEIELKAEDEDFILPSWIGQELTGQSAYYNVTLALDSRRQ